MVEYHVRRSARGVSTDGAVIATPPVDGGVVPHSLPRNYRIAAPAAVASQQPRTVMLDYSVLSLKTQYGSLIHP